MNIEGQDKIHTKGDLPNMAITKRTKSITKMWQHRHTSGTGAARTNTTHDMSNCSGRGGNVVSTSLPNLIQVLW